MLKQILTIIITICSLTLNGQMQNKTWHQFPTAGAVGSSVTDRTSAINILENGRIYFTFHDQNTSKLTINRFDLVTNQWNLINEVDLSGVTIEFMNTYSAGNRLYISWVAAVSGATVSIARLDEMEQLVFLVNDEVSSMDVFQNNSTHFTIDEIEGIAYMVVKGLNSEVYVDQYDLISGAYITGTYAGYLSGAQPKIALDYDNATIYVVGNDFSGFLILSSSPLGATLNFTPVGGGSGYVYSSLYTNEAVSTNFNIVEKTGNSPELIFNHNDGTGEDYNVRLGIGSNLASEVALANNDLIRGVSGSARGANSFILGHNNTTFEIIVAEIFPNGTVDLVAQNTNPILSSQDGEAYKMAHNKVNNRLAIFYHALAGNGSDGGKVGFTNTAPQIVSYDTQLGCSGDLSVFLKNIIFSDAEGDEVVILNDFQSTNAAVIDPLVLFAYESGNNNWVIDGSTGMAGFTDVTFSYTDGLDTVSETVSLEVVTPSIPVFTEFPIALCLNEGQANLQEYVDLTGGIFSVNEQTILDGILELAPLNNPSGVPYQANLGYEYKDLNGCISYITTDLFVYNIPEVTLAITNSACGASSGQIEATVVSPNGSFFSYWNTGDQDVLTINNLNPGSYYLNVFDAQGCKSVTQGTVEASDITVTAQINEVSCYNGNNGSIALNISGPNAPYTVFWSTGSGALTAQNLSPGIYEAVITDVNGCQITYSYTLNNPAKLGLELVSTSPSFCGANDGALESVVTNGIGNISYQWSTGATSMNLSGLSGGMFSLTVTDGNGCKASKSKNVIPSTGIFGSGNVSRANCDTNDGAIEVDLFPAFGQSVASIQWSNGATTQNVYNLSPGYYECIATQSDGCVSTFGWNVGSFKPQKPSICIVTVDTVTTTNLIVWEKPITTAIDHYRIYRETSQAGHYQLIDTVHYSNISVFNDVVASPKTKSWRYKISAVNACGDESALSSSHKTIHLITQDLGLGEFKVTWDNYEGFLFNNYDLYRHTNLTGWQLVLDDVPFLALPYTFDVPPTTDGLDYMIVIDPGFQCTATFGKAQDYNSSRSNKAKGAFNPGSGTGDPNNNIVEFESETMSVSIYPNPSSGIFNVNMNFTNVNSQATLTVTDVSGKMILQQEVANGMNVMNLENVNAGIYFVSIRDKNANIVVRVLKN